MKLIKKHMTLEEYETKYPKYQTKLLSFSDAEIKEFNSKFAKNNGNKQILDKYALLNKYKWVHIKDRYYQIPQKGKVIGITGGCAVIVAAAVALPIILLNNVTLNEQEFKDVLTWFATPAEDRKFLIDNGSLTVSGLSQNKMDESMKVSIKSEVEGYKEKTTMSYSDANPEYVITYHDTDTEQTYTYNPEYNPESGEYDEYHWRNYSSKSPLFSSFITGDFLTYSKNYSKFVKKGLDTYAVSNIEVPTVIGFIEPSLKDLKGVATAYISFNKDKSIKGVKEEVKIDLSQIYPKITSVITLTSDYKITGIGTHSISKFPKWEGEDNNYNLYGEYGNYIYNSHDFIKGGIKSTFITEVTDDTHPVDKFVIYENPLTSIGDQPFNFDGSTFKVYVDDVEDTTAKLSDDKCAIIFNEVNTKGSTIKIELTPENDIEYFSSAVVQYSKISYRMEFDNADKLYRSASALISGFETMEFNVYLNGTNNVGLFKITSQYGSYFNGYELKSAKVGDVNQPFTKKEDADGNIWYEFDTPVTGSEGDILSITASLTGEIDNDYYAVGESAEVPQTYTLAYSDSDYTYAITESTTIDKKVIFKATVDSSDQNGIDLFHLVDNNGNNVELPSDDNIIVRNGEDIVTFTIDNNNLKLDETITESDSVVTFILDYSDSEGVTSPFTATATKQSQ